MPVARVWGLATLASIVYAKYWPAVRGVVTGAATVALPSCRLELAGSMSWEEGDPSAAAVILRPLMCSAAALNVQCCNMQMCSFLPPHFLPCYGGPSGTYTAHSSCHALQLTAPLDCRWCGGVLESRFPGQHPGQHKHKHVLAVAVCNLHSFVHATWGHVSNGIYSCILRQLV